MNDLIKFVKQIKNRPEKIEFEEVIKVIDGFYSYTATRFSNGTGNEIIENAAGENEGSCKIFSFAQLHQLNKTQTLNCFGHYYRDDVLKHPQGSDHTNIRLFIKYGWQQVKFDSAALELKG